VLDPYTGMVRPEDKVKDIAVTAAVGAKIVLTESISITLPMTYRLPVPALSFILAVDSRIILLLPVFIPML